MRIKIGDLVKHKDREYQQIRRDLGWSVIGQVAWISGWKRSSRRCFVKYPGDDILYEYSEDELEKVDSFGN